jgi:hypothetical protein
MGKRRTPFIRGLVPVPSGRAVGIGPEHDWSNSEPGFFLGGPSTMASSQGNWLVPGAVVAAVGRLKSVSMAREPDLDVSRGVSLGADLSDALADTSVSLECLSPKALNRLKGDLMGFGWGVARPSTRPCALWPGTTLDESWYPPLASVVLGSIGPVPAFHLFVSSSNFSCSSCLSFLNCRASLNSRRSGMERTRRRGMPLSADEVGEIRRDTLPRNVSVEDFEDEFWDRFLET